MGYSSVRVTGSGGVQLAVHQLGGSGPPVMLAHATGFHGRCWTPLASVLARSYTVWAIDQRGHGASDRPPDGRYDDWDHFATDLLAAVDTIGGTGWRAGGHSLGGGVCLLAEARRPGTFSAICCYEPVAVPPGQFAGTGSAARGGNPLAVLARKRRPSFESRVAALENYRSKSPFARVRIRPPWRATSSTASSTSPTGPSSWPAPGTTRPPFSKGWSTARPGPRCRGCGRRSRC